MFQHKPLNYSQKAPYEKNYYPAGSNHRGYASGL
jgi:hypothetical protein